MQVYNEKILETVESLIEVRNHLFDKLINIGMLKEFSEVNEVMEEGDIYKFELSHFENSSDVNVNLLVELIKKIEETTYSICNLNNIEIDGQ